MTSFSNHLKDSTSPYLLQHAHNPVDWYPWGPMALEKARAEGKPILLSIGYSACHWCHVMAHESFENEELAKIMNERFVNIKLDREERPDIDHIYMDAIQQMGLRGGWPLNVFLTSDQRPFYGGTYFPPDKWKQVLIGVSDAYQHNYEKLSESADSFTKALQTSELLRNKSGDSTSPINQEALVTAISGLAARFDRQWGGMNRSPKFPMPATWKLLLAYGHFQSHQDILNHTLFTLDKIEMGGIYDQIGGGFARYSVDGEWHVPHFEKMLYDNGQLMSLFASAYKLTQKSSYLNVLTQTATWLEREMLSPAGGFYAALDADSEGVEGKFYVWDKAEIEQLAEENVALICAYFDVSAHGNWEETNVLRRLYPDDAFSEKHGLSVSALREIVEQFHQKALEKRSQRIRPGLDSKILSGWNGLMLSGLLEAYQATENPLFEKLAKTNANFLQSKMIIQDRLIRTLGSTQPAFLEDYAAVIQAFINCYETFFDETHLMLARALTDVVLDEFLDAEEGLFFFTGASSEALIARKKELFDNVIPASNSMMADNLYRLGIMLDDDRYREVATRMVSQVSGLIESDPEFMANWAQVALRMNAPTPEVVLVGLDFQHKAEAIQRHYLPNKIIMGTEATSSLPLFAFKTAGKEEAMIYVCFNKTCKVPVLQVEEAMKQLVG